MLIGNPVPVEDAIDIATVDAWIAAALRDAAAEGVAGKAVTPFLLKRMFELSGRRSLRANIALVRSNARLASRIAAALIAARQA